MKKMIIVTMVLGMATMASAALSIGGYDGRLLQESDIVTLTFSGDGQDQAIDPLWVQVTGPGSIDAATGVWTFDAFTPVPAFIDLSANIPGTTMINAVEPAQEPSLLDGQFATLDFHCDGLGEVVVNLLNGSNMELLDTITIQQVPEPASMGLLALGGLFLRRRK